MYTLCTFTSIPNLYDYDVKKHLHYSAEKKHKSMYLCHARMCECYHLGSNEVV